VVPSPRYVLAFMLKCVAEILGALAASEGYCQLMRDTLRGEDHIGVMTVILSNTCLRCAKMRGKTLGCFGCVRGLLSNNMIYIIER
jgi:hypothetical protein